MSLTDREIIQRLKIKSRDRVLDVGGSMKQHAELQIDTLVDIISPEESPYTPSGLKAKHFVRLDITHQKLPFRNKEFDICLCTHTLEDLPSPFLTITEMSRVAKRGLIITPSMGTDMVFSHIDFTNWLTGARRVPGNSHHKWFFQKKKNGLRILPKNYGILYSGKFQITGWDGEEEMQFFWKDKINYEFVRDLNIHTLIDEYEKYIERNSKRITKGKVHFYFDNPFIYLKEGIKLLLRRGKGFKYRRQF